MIHICSRSERTTALCLETSEFKVKTYILLGQVGPSVMINIPQSGASSQLHQTWSKVILCKSIDATYNRPQIVHYQMLFPSCSAQKHRGGGPLATPTNPSISYNHSIAARCPPTPESPPSLPIQEETGCLGGHLKQMERQGGEMSERNQTVPVLWRRWQKKRVWQRRTGGGGHVEQIISGN